MGEPFSVVSWNIFQGLDHHSKRHARRRNTDLVDHLVALDADVLLLPECWRYRQPNATWANELADELGYTLHQWVSDKPSRRKDIAAWRMVIMTRIPARRLPDQVAPAFAPFGQRAIVRVELSESGLQVAGAHQLGVHLLRKWRPLGWLKERAELRTATANNDIVGGDLNIWSPVVRRDSGSLRPAVAGRTFPANRPHSQIDHLLVSDRVEVLSSEILPDMGSDHLAIKAVLKPK